MCNDGLTVLSLFDGMSCGAIALREAGIRVKQYFASEIDNTAIRQTRLNFPDTVQLGNVVGLDVSRLPPIDLLIGGSPCQGFSFAGKQLNFKDPRSVLFFEYVRILREIQKYNPDVKFLLENVRMLSEYENIISSQLGIFPVAINSALLSAQNRYRLYWTNIRTKSVRNLFGSTLHTDIPQPEDRGIYLRDILECDVDSRFYLKSDEIDKLVRQREYGVQEQSDISEDNILDLWFDPTDCNIQFVRHDFERIDPAKVASINPFLPPPDVARVPIQAIQMNHLIIDCCNESSSTLVIPGSVVKPQFGGGFRPIVSGKASCLVASSSKFAAMLIANGDDMVIRYLTPAECCRIQTIPDWYEWDCSEPQIYRLLGNGWTVNVISHIFQFFAIQ